MTAEELGGWKVCVEIAGTVHNVAEDDEEAIDLARAYLDFFPSSRHAVLGRRTGPETGLRETPRPLDIIPPNSRRPYAVRVVIDELVDERDFFEVQPLYGRAIVTGWGRVGGQVVGFVANNPAFGAGRWTLRRRSRRPI